MSNLQEGERGSDRLPEGLGEALVQQQFLLNDTDLSEVARCRGPVNRLGFAVQLCTLRSYGFFLSKLIDVPDEVRDTLASQLGLLSIGLDGYPSDENTRHTHLERIRTYLGYVRCGEVERERLAAHLSVVARSTPRTESLRQSGHGWLFAHRVVRPGRTTLRDLIASAREAALEATYLTLTRELKAEQESQLDALLGAGDNQESAWPRSPIEALKLPAKKESADTLLFLLARLTTLLELGLSNWPAVHTLPPEMRRQLALWGYRYDAWSLRRFPPAKRRAVLLCFLSMATAVTTDAVVNALDKVMNDIHNKARKRRQQLFQASQEARSRAVEVLEVLGTLTLDETIPDPGLRSEIIQRYPREELTRLVEGSRQLREGDGSYYRLTESSWDYTRRFSPTLLRVMPFQWAEGSLIGQAVVHLRTFNASGKRKLGNDVPTGWLPPKWQPCVLTRQGGHTAVSRPHYELALLSTLVEKLKAGDVTVQHSRQWADFEDYLIPKDRWQSDREAHYAQLNLPLDAATYLENLDQRLHAVTGAVNTGVPRNEALRIDAAKGEWKLAALRTAGIQSTARAAKALIERHLPARELVDIVIDLDARMDLLRAFLPDGEKSPWPRGVQRRNALAALIAVGCNIGAARMASASGLSVREITAATDGLLTEDALRTASVELVNFASKLPMAAVYGTGDTCSADGMRFYVPVNILAADYSHLLGGRGVNMYVHTTDTSLRLYQQAIPVRLREATFVLDGLLDHGTELDPGRVFTDSHGFSEVVMASAALLARDLAPRIANVHEQTLYKLDRSKVYEHLDPILKGTIKTHVVREAWDEVVRVMASIQTGTATASLILHRLGSYARQNRVHQALAEIGRAEKTMHILRTAGSEEFRRIQARELNKGEASNDLSRFLFFGQEGALRGREFGDQAQSFSALAVLHNAVVAWNMIEVEGVVARLRAAGHDLPDEVLGLTTPLLRKHINPFGRYHFDLGRLRD